MEQKANRHLETEPVGMLMRKYAVPCIISLLVAALYNIRATLRELNTSITNESEVQSCSSPEI